MKKLKIAIIDSNFENLSDSFRQICDEKNDVKNVLKSLIPSAEFHCYDLRSINRFVFDIDLIDILKDIVSKEKFDVIHLCCGIIFFDCVTELVEVLDSIRSDGTLIFSSYNYSRDYNFPLGFEELIRGLRSKDEKCIDADSMMCMKRKRKKSCPVENEYQLILSLAELYRSLSEDMCIEKITE